ncbi:uncharacterized protein LOC117781731 [Drosophila innubila]|uniref:uncharacterized protein LOC117781731 n=1 Tax=Drosophila innubila TaxID=198719 RepID=UPI00148B718E|nr:uncharacterized protein LOC117781731 [Drosophila innubila]
MGVSKGSSVLYLFGFFLLFNGVFAIPSLIRFNNLEQDEGTGVFIANPNLIQPKDFVQERATGDSKYPELYRVNLRKFAGYTGFRSVFQWSIGKTVNNYGIQNAMKFSANELNNANKQISGDIGIYSNGSQIGVHLSLKEGASSSSAGKTFKCSNNFPFIPGSHACFNSNYTLIPKAIYFLDIEIRDRTISGYISQPQTNLTNISNPNLPRILIGEIKWFNSLRNLSPDTYWIANSYKSCGLSSEITAYNYLPELYNNLKRQKAVIASTNLYPGCGALNSLAMTDWTNVVYISRPTPVINGTNQ